MSDQQSDFRKSFKENVKENLKQEAAKRLSIKRLRKKRGVEVNARFGQ